MQALALSITCKSIDEAVGAAICNYQSGKNTSNGTEKYALVLWVSSKTNHTRSYQDAGRPGKAASLLSLEIRFESGSGKMLFLSVMMVSV